MLIYINEKNMLIDTKDIQKYEDAIAVYKRTCKCGHVVEITKGNKKLCSHCGHYVYLDPKDEFQERLLSAMRVRKNEKFN